MAKTHRYVVPHMLVNGDQEAMLQNVVAGGYDDALPEDDQYEVGDLVEVVDGTVRKSRRAAAADIPALFMAGANYDQPFAIRHNGHRSRTIDDVFTDVIPERNIFVFTYQGASADGADELFEDADLAAVHAQERRDIVWNATEGCYTVRDTATAPRVTLLGVFRGEVGDSNVQVLARLEAVEE